MVCAMVCVCKVRYGTLIHTSLEWFDGVDVPSASSSLETRGKRHLVFLRLSHQQPLPTMNASHSNSPVQPSAESDVGTAATAIPNSNVTRNENPTILSVDTRRKVPQKVQVFGSTSNVADLAVQRALTETSIATNGKGVVLLKNMGITLPDKPQVSPFLYAPMTWREEHSNDKKTEATEEEDLTTEEVFEIIRNIQDPEHPLTLEQLGVVSRQQIEIDHTTTTAVVAGQQQRKRKRVMVHFTPTIPHCSMATQIGLCLQVKLDRSLPAALYKTTVKIEPGTHASENAINKQLADKERVCAALENQHLLGIVNRCIMNGLTGNMV